RGWADGEMAEEDAGGRTVEDGGEARRIEDRHPADAEAFGAGGEPQRVDGNDHGIVERLGHGEAAEPTPLRGRAVCEHGELARCVVEAGELEPRIERGAVWRLRTKRVGVALLQPLADPRPPPSVLPHHQA